MKQVTLPIAGMHCASCEVIVGDELGKVPGVASARVSVKDKQAIVSLSRPVTHEALQSAVEAAGYSVEYEKKPLVNRSRKDWRTLLISAAIVAVLAGIISYFGLIDVHATSTSSQGAVTALIIGLTAGFSTCMALIGGLVLGISARHAEKHPDATVSAKFRPHLFFNLGRITSFFLLGALIGAFGSLFQINGIVLGVLMIVVSIVMLLIGIKLTNIFPRFSGGGITLPRSITTRLGIDERKRAEYSAHNSATLGALTFFLPCGFTQAMQLYAISTGDPATGALIMGLFAIGTAPGLLGIGGLVSVVKKQFATNFFKFAGVAVIALALVNGAGGWRLTGWNLLPQSSVTTVSANITGDEEVAEENILRTTFVLPTNVPPDQPYPSLIIPNDFTVKAGQVYTLQVEAKDDGVGCMSTILIPGLVNEPQLLTKGTLHQLTFKAERPGTYYIACAMGVPFGEITVT